MSCRWGLVGEALNKQTNKLMFLSSPCDSNIWTGLDPLFCVEGAQRIGQAEAGESGNPPWAPRGYAALLCDFKLFLQFSEPQLYERPVNWEWEYLSCRAIQNLKQIIRVQHVQNSKH